MTPSQIKIGRTYQTRRLGRYRAHRVVTSIRDGNGILTAFYRSLRGGYLSEHTYRMSLEKFAEGCVSQLKGKKCRNIGRPLTWTT